MSKLAKQMARNLERNKKRFDRTYSKSQRRVQVGRIHSDSLFALCKHKGVTDGSPINSRRDDIIPHNLDIYNM